MSKKDMTAMVKNKEELKKTLADLRKTKKEKQGEFRKAKKELRRISRRITVTKMAEEKKKKPAQEAPASSASPAQPAPQAQPAPETSAEKAAEPKT